VPYNLELEKQVDQVAGKRWPKLEKKHMFGGVCYQASGNMSFGIWKDQLIVRTEQQKAEEMLKRENTKPFDITGRPMKGWFMVTREGYDGNLQHWLDMGMDFASGLPPKGKK
jgi:hypothetical protein